MFRCLFAAVMVAGCWGAVWADEFQIATSANLTAPLKKGDSLPDVSVKDRNGNPVSLDSLHGEGPVVIVFFRGSWCPYCTRHFQELVKIVPEVKELGATMVAISPDSVEKTRENTEKLKIPFPILSDSDVSAAKAFGLAFTVDDATLARYQKFGIDLEKASGEKHNALPVPAVFIVDKSGKIVFAHSDPDYTQRLNPQVILDELKKGR